MFSNGRARSGIIVLPCGAGKTLTGITVACTIQKSVIVVCTSMVSAEQWKREFIKWSLINPSDILIFTSQTINQKKNEKDFKFLFKSEVSKEDKEAQHGKTLVLICTYTMLSMQRERRENSASKLMMDFIMEHHWGLMLLDEVQVLPANNFSKITEKVKAHCKLGLTATLFREDNRISNIDF